MPNGIGPKPPPPAAGRRGTDTDFNLALGMDGSAPARLPMSWLAFPDEGTSWKHPSENLVPSFCTLFHSVVRLL